MNVLYTWLGMADLRASSAEEPNRALLTGRSEYGPVADFLLHPPEAFDHVLLFYDHEGDKSRGQTYRTWLEQLLAQHGRPFQIELAPCRKGSTALPGDTLSSRGGPTDYQWVYEVMRTTIERFERREGVIGARHYLVGPGTPTMAVCTVLISRLKACVGKLWQTDQRSPVGYRLLQLPVGLSLTDGPDPASALDSYRPAPSQEIIVCSPQSRRAWMLAERAGKSRWPVLILGPTGAGKNELVRRIHQASGLPGEPLALNCAALPETTIESELFGHRKGAFTGADKDHPGIFEAAGHGTVFLDEIGELPLAAQATLLRVLQEKKVRRLGENHERPIHCRIIAATHRNLWQAVEERRFRALPAPISAPVAVGDMRTLLKRYQKQLVEEALKQSNGNKTQAAKRLGITPQHLARLLK